MAVLSLHDSTSLWRLFRRPRTFDDVESAAAPAEVRGCLTILPCNTAIFVDTFAVTVRRNRCQSVETSSFVTVEPSLDEGTPPKNGWPRSVDARTQHRSITSAV